jgi:hypothetical protein
VRRSAGAGRFRGEAGRKTGFLQPAGTVFGGQQAVKAAIGVLKGRLDRVPAEQKRVFAGAPFAALLVAGRAAPLWPGRPLLPALAAGLFCTSFLSHPLAVIVTGLGLWQFCAPPAAGYRVSPAGKGLWPLLGLTPNRPVPIRTATESLPLRRGVFVCRSASTRSTIGLRSALKCVPGWTRLKVESPEGCPSG